MRTPAAPWIGSPTNAATFSGPTSRIFFSTSAAAMHAEFLRGNFAAEIVPIGLQDVLESGQRQAPLPVHAGHSAERGGDHRRSVIAAPATDQDTPIRLALEGPVVANEADHGVVRLRARADEKDALEPFGQQARHLGGELGRRDGRGLEERVVVRQVEHLAIGDLGELLASVADVHAPQTRHRIENLGAARVPDPHAVCMGDDPGAATRVERLVIRERMEMVVGVLRHQLGDVDVSGWLVHGGLLLAF